MVFIPRMESRRARTGWWQMAQGNLTRLSSGGEGRRVYPTGSAPQVYRLAVKVFVCGVVEAGIAETATGGESVPAASADMGGHLSSHPWIPIPSPRVAGN